MTPVDPETKNVEIVAGLALGSCVSKTRRFLSKGFGGCQGSLLLKLREDKTIFD